MDYYKKYVKYKSKYTNLSSIKSGGGTDNKEIIRMLKDKEYPYYEYFFNKKMLKTLFNELNEKDIKNKIEIIKKRYEDNDAEKIAVETDEIKYYRPHDTDDKITVIYDIKDTIRMEVLTDYFVEKVRLKCKNASKNLTEIEDFNRQQNRDKFFKNLEKGMSVYKSKMLFKRNTRFWACGLFPVEFVYRMHTIFKPKNILDMSAGWGDRLIGAMAHGCENYYGVDPNLEMKDKYEELIKFYKKNNGTYKLIPKKFEDTTMEDFDGKTFDVMLSSPPYFLAEEYTKEKGYDNNLDIWLNTFIFPSFKMIWKLLNKGGRIFLIITDTAIMGTQYVYTDRIIKFIKNFEGCVYEGMQQYRHKNYFDRPIIQPIWIFYKNK